VDAGLALVEMFKLSCSGWKNCLGVENHKLNYSIHVSYKDSTARPQFYSGDSSSVSLLLPAGDDVDHFRNQLTIVVTNNAYYNAEFPVYPVTVR